MGECKCEYYETSSGFKYKVKHCTVCKENPLLVIADTIVSVSALVNVYKELAIVARKANEEISKIGK